MEDQRLIWQCRRGSRDALRRIYEKYHVDLLKLAVVLTGDTHAGQDVVHDVFVKFARSVRGVSLTGSLKGYLVVSTVNRVRDYRRDRQRRGEQGLEQAATAVAPTRPPEQWAILSEQLERLSRAMGQLPYEQREAVALHVQAGLTFRGIARRQNTSISTAQGRYRYGIEKLRSLLNHSGSFPAACRVEAVSRLFRYLAACCEVVHLESSHHETRRGHKEAISKCGAEHESGYP